MSKDKCWIFNTVNIPTERCHWLAIEEHYGPELSEFVAGGFYDPEKGKFYFSDGEEITGKVIAWMEKDQLPAFPDREAV